MAVLDDTLRQLGTEIEAIELPKAATTVEAVAQATGVSAERLVKSLVVVVDSQFHLVFVFGHRRLNLEKLRAVVGGASVRMASRKEVRKVTGYDPGDVPPIDRSWAQAVWMDCARPNDSWVIGGGGHSNRLFRIQIAALVQHTSPTEVDVADEPTATS